MQTHNEKNNAEMVLNQLRIDLMGSIKQKNVALLMSQDFWWVVNGGEKFLLDTDNGLLWEGEPDTRMKTAKRDGNLQTSMLRIDDWDIPSISQMIKFSKLPNNPMKVSETALASQSIWLVKGSKSQIINVNLLDKFHNNSAKYDTEASAGAIIYVNSNIAHDLGQFIDFALSRGLKIFAIGQTEENDILQEMGQIPLTSLYADIDYNRCRLPKLDASQFTDPNKGVWEFEGLEQPLLDGASARSRNPLQDVEYSNIGIDFGTSSTVVAYEDINGRAKLLRIGVDDYYEKVLPEHYENPTVLEFVDFQAMLQAWTNMVQQPLVSWNDVRCSHEALHSLRNNDSNHKVIASILYKLKQWALREANHDAIRLSDQKHAFEHQLAPLELRNPVKGSALQVSNNDVFDPIELYAWFLGLNINWRSRGLFLKYYMTFPVAYPKDVKEKILSSFRRGLLRSLPDALTQNTEVMEKFIVEERASEPAAYVAASIKSYGLEPTDEGIAYGVFDFGGGTTDFDFGYYRWATDEENEQSGIEEVFEHYEAAGDKFLGGENLLENMAYLVFRENLDICREKKIVFTRPLDADDFAGSEMLVDKTQAAHTNTLILISQLRSFWEENKVNAKGILSLTLLDRSGDKVLCELQASNEKLSDYLNQRIAQGVKSFFIAMQKAFASNMPKQVHVLLAGNASKSVRVLELFKKQSNEYDKSEYDEVIPSKLFNGNTPEMVIHEPLIADVNDESKPTAKTGVALGILRLCPGTVVDVINHASVKSNGEAPFAFYVGRGRRGKLLVGLHRNCPYNEWREMGVVPKEGVFNFYVTESNLAYGDKMDIGHPELYKKSITFSTAYVGQKIYVSSKTPFSMNIGCTDAEDLNSLNDLQEFVLMN